MPIRDAARERNNAAALTDEDVTNATPEVPPTVVSVAVSSDPRSGTDSDTYGVGEEIEFTVTFSKAVEVSGSRPHFEFSLGPMGGGVDKEAAYDSGSGTTALVFAYTVVAADTDDNGIWIGDQGRTLKVEAGEYIRAVDDRSTAVLTHAEVGTQSEHKVNGSLTPPFGVVSVVVSSDPHSGALSDTYGVGEVIVFTVTFSKAVVVTGRPHFEFALGPSRTRSR